MRTKVVFVGGGSFVFGPAMLSQAILENRSTNLDIVLVDPQIELTNLMVELGDRMKAVTHADVSLTASTDLATALEGADFVISCAAVQLNRRFAIDREIVLRHDPAALITEFGGVAGISYSLRQCAFVKSMTTQIKAISPTAKLLNIANPLPRVCEMAIRQGVATVGFCSVSISGYGRIGLLLDDQWEDYPFARNRAKYVAKMGGTNHLSWLIDLREQGSEDSILPRLRASIAQRTPAHPSKSLEWATKTGYLPMPGDDHIQDFLPPEGLEHSISISSHGSEQDRVRRLQELKDVASGALDVRSLEIHPAWERPFDVIGALMGREAIRVDSLNLVNQGQIPQLPMGSVVETACRVDGSGIHPEKLDLPGSVAEPCRLAATLSRTIVDAAEQSSRRLLQEAVELDPTILDKALGMAALYECLIAHRDLIGNFDVR